MQVTKQCGCVAGDRCHAWQVNGGFTYLWVLMSVALISLGLVVAADLYSTSLRRQQEAELMFIGRQFQQALSSYHNVTLPNGMQEYPASIDDLLEDKRGLVVRRHLRKLYFDPIMTTAQWGEIRIGGRIVGIHSLSEAVPLKQEGFDDDLSQLAHARSLKEWVFGDFATVLK